MSRQFEVERHDFVTGRMQTLINELEQSLYRVRTLLVDALERNHELQKEAGELRSQLDIVTTRLNNLLEPKL